LNLSSEPSGIAPEVLKYIANLPLGSHAIFYYDTEQEAAQVFKSYLQGGLERHEAVHLIAPNHEVYTDFLRNADVGIEPLEKDRRLGFTLISDFLVDKGRLSSAKALQSAVRLTQEDRELGFKGTRTFTPSTERYYLEYCSPSDLLRYERELGPSFSLPLSGFCSYSSRRLAELGLHDLLISLFQPHGQIIAKGLTWAQPGSVPSGPIEFNEMVVTTVQETIAAILGRSVSDAFMKHLQTYLRITKEEMPHRLNELFMSLRDCFGVGGDTIGRYIVRELYEKAGVKFVKHNGWALVKYIEVLKQKLAEKELGAPSETS
jgi:hypothetical protein